jgi:hypothetical protein
MTEMDDAKDNVDVFNRVVAEIFGELYNFFPIPARISPHSIAEKLLGEERFWTTDDLGDDGAREVTREGRQYRDECGFIVQRADQRDFILSPKAFEVLAATPSSLSAKGAKSFGKQLASVSATVGDRVSTAVVNDLVGQVIGAAVRWVSIHGAFGG